MSLAREFLASIVAELRADPSIARELRELLGVAPAAAAAPEPLYLAVPQFARRLGVSERTGWSWVRQGLPSVGSGRTRRVHVPEADRWLRERRDVVDDAIEQSARKAAREAARRASR